MIEVRVCGLRLRVGLLGRPAFGSSIALLVLNAAVLSGIAIAMELRGDVD